MPPPVPPRKYESPQRDAAAAETRARLIEAAGRLLSERGGKSASLDAVAKAAGATRLTVYNQFGSRRGLLEAVFDERARGGGLTRIPELMANPDPRAVLHGLIEIFCGFWAFDPAIARLQEEAWLDPEFAQAIAERNERRRKTFRTVVERLTTGLEPSATDLDDATDLLFTLTSQPSFKSLSHHRDQAEVCALIQKAADALLAARFPQL